MAILTELKDPRVRDVTVTGVEVTPDMRQAKVHVSVMGSETQQNLSLRGLQNSAGFLQSKVGKRIDTRYTPRLTFVLDLGIKRSIEISQILQSVLPHEETIVGKAEAAERARLAARAESGATDSDDDDLEDEDSDDGAADDDDSEADAGESDDDGHHTHDSNKPTEDAADE